MTEFLFFSSPIFILLEATLLGAFLGLQREMVAQQSIKDQSFMGLRTMALLALLGAISTLFPTLPILPVVFFTIIAILVAIAYAHGSFVQNRIGMTTEFSALMTFWIGVLVGTNEQLLAILITIFLAAINTYKESLHKFAKTLDHKEWIGAFQLVVFSGAVLPFLPKEAIDPWGVFNPFKIWLLVLAISAIGFIGYFLVKYLGKKGGILLISFLGAIASSTATTIALAEKSKSWNFPSSLASGIMIAQGVMCLRILGIIFVLSGLILTKTIGVLTLMGGTSFIMAYLFWKNSQKNKSKYSFEKEIKSPFQIGPAIKFGALFSAILFGIHFGKTYLGELGTSLTAFFSGIIDADITVLSSLEALTQKGISTTIAETTILIAIFTNTAVKIGYVHFLGSKDLIKKIALGIGVVILTGIGISTIL